MKQYLIPPVAALLLFFTAVNDMLAQRPKIGLALSGGGAKGLAHIGILQALDSAGLKIDYITGTSMGSIMGAMYAAGYSGDTIEYLSRQIDWNLLFSTSPQLSAISVEEKKEYDKYALEVPVLKGKFMIGKGIIEGQELWLKMSEMFEPVYNITDFSKLPIPFKCMGTDLETGKVVEMDHGNIVTAIRASMAIPSVFTPVRYDDKLLVDGGVVNNFPVMNAKQMGADYVIGVNLSMPLEEVEKLTTALDIMLQIAFFKDAETFETNMKACDLYIMPELKGYATGDFAFSDSIIDCGKEAGAIYYPVFKRFADSLDAIYGKREFVKNRLPDNPIVSISKYTVDGLTNTSEKFFFGLLDLKSNKAYSYKKMSEAIRKVYGSRYYKIIRYDFSQANDGTTEMHFHVVENPLTALKIGINYNDYTKLGLKFNITSRDLVFKESRIMASVSVSENPRIYGEYYKFITRQRNTRIVLDYYMESVDYPVYQDFSLYQTLRSFYNAFDFQIQRNISRFSYVGAGQQFIQSKIKTIETPELIYNGHNNYWMTYLSYVLNNVNQKYFPTNGWYVKAEVGYVYSQDPEFEYSYKDTTVQSESIPTEYNDYVRIYINANHYMELNKKFSFSQNFTLGYIIDKNPYIANAFLVGGVSEVIRNQTLFIGLKESQVKTGSIASAQLGLQYKLTKSAFATLRFNAGMYDFESDGFNNMTSKDNLLTGYGLTFGYNSAIGPLEFTVMHCDQDTKVRTSINIGFSF